MKGKRLAVYSRVSTADQSVEMQLQDLRRFAEARGYTIVEEFSDSGISGTTRKRPALDRLMDAARKRQFDVVAVWRFDRFARSTKHLLDALSEFRHLGIDFVSYQENLDTSSPLGEAMFTIIGAMAQLERNIIVERVRAGVAKARPTKAHWGRPPVEMAHPKKVERMHQLRREGRSYHAIADEVGLSSRTVWKVLTSAHGADSASPASYLGVA